MNDHPAAHAAVKLTDLAAELLADAAGSPNHRAARTLITGSAQRVTMIALAAGAALAEHSSPPAASLQVVQGEVRLQAGQRHWPLQAGTLIAIPAQRHSVEAVTDAVFLLTVAVN
jgi:quercetin dioxygenase-like cupin family protein